MTISNLHMTISNLLKTNVNEHTERKNGLTYLSWAWAWAEALKADPKATYKVEMFDGKPFMDINGTAMVWVTVTIFDKSMTCQLPVMDSANDAIPFSGKTVINKFGKERRIEFDSFAVNTAIMRCLTKAISLHGLGLYIYAGEDLPEAEQQAVKDTYKAFEESFLSALREASLNGSEALKKAFADLPKNQDAKTLWVNHGKSLKEAAAKFDQQEEKK